MVDRKGWYSMAFYDYREPIERVVDKYFENKRWHSENSNELLITNGTSIQAGLPNNLDLPEAPCKLFRNEQGQVDKIIYGNFESLESEEECCPMVWQEELIRNEQGQVVKILTTYPDGSVSETELIRNEDGKVESFM